MAKTTKKNTVQKKATPQAQHCPYCDVEMQALNLPVCQACHIEIKYCPHCGHPLEKGAKVCSSCGC
ncbi:MAG: zinc ribbon domain-containing protein [Dehalococcoidales bacterium]